MNLPHNLEHFLLALPLLGMVLPRLIGTHHHAFDNIPSIVTDDAEPGDVLTVVTAGEDPTWEPAAGAPHDLLDGDQDQDTLAGSVVAGDVIYGNDTPKWARKAISIPGAVHLFNFFGITNGETTPSWKALFDATSPSTQAFGDSAVVGVADVAAHRDHKHAMPASPTTGYATVQDEGSPLTQRSTVNFVGAGVSAADSGGVTVVTISGGTGGGGSVSNVRSYISFGTNMSGQSYTP